MAKINLLSAIWLLLVPLCIVGCSATNDFKLYRSRMPKSVLVLPPLNHTNSIEATDLFLATVSEPIAESGYYVFSPFAVQAFLRGQGIPSAEEAQKIPLAKLKEVFGADAVLYVDIIEWGQQYLVISSSASVSVSMRLVDLKTEATIWTASARAVDKSQSNGNDGLAGLIANALVHALMETSKEDMLKLASQASFSAFHDTNNGMLLGPRRPNASLDTRGIEEPTSARR